MAEYLSKEEIKQWRSSLEKITLEEYAARLGKVVAESRPTNDLVDIVMSGDSSSTTEKYKNQRNEKLSNIAERAFERERQLSHTPFSFKAPVEEPKKVQEVKQSLEAKSSNEVVDKILKRQEKDNIENNNLKEEVNIVLKKNLTDREQIVFDYFLNNRNKTVYAKDLAALLSLPRDYIYKYIKNLRAKIEGDKLKNADRGGFILSD